MELLFLGAVFVVIGKVRKSRQRKAEELRRQQMGPGVTMALLTQMMTGVPMPQKQPLYAANSMAEKQKHSFAGWIVFGVLFGMIAYGYVSAFQPYIKILGFKGFLQMLFA